MHACVSACAVHACLSACAVHVCMCMRACMTQSHWQFQGHGQHKEWRTKTQRDSSEYLHIENQRDGPGKTASYHAHQPTGRNEF